MHGERTSVLPSRHLNLYAMSCSVSMNPIEWFRKSMAPQIREKDSEKDVEEAREKLRESGVASIFETVEEEATSKAAVKAKKEKATSVSWRAMLCYDDEGQAPSIIDGLLNG